MGDLILDLYKRIMSIIIKLDKFFCFLFFSMIFIHIERIFKIFVYIYLLFYPKK